MGMEYTDYIEHVDEKDLDWKIDDAKDDVQRARDQMLVIAASFPEDGQDAEGNIIDKEDRLLYKFNESYGYLVESVINLHRLECAKSHIEFKKFNLQEIDNGEKENCPDESDKS